MSSQRKVPRPRGTGSLYVYRGSWYGTWWVGGRQRKRKVGPLRQRGTRDGLTKVQAEVRLRRMMEETNSIPVIPERLTLADATARYIAYVETVRELKPSTIQDYRIMLARHFEPYFGTTELAKVDDEDIAAYMLHKKKPPWSLQSKTINNHRVFLNGVYEFAVKRRWTTINPVAAVERARSRSARDLRFLEPGEVEALISAAPGDLLGPLDRVLYLAATTTGLRQGELIALRWRDVDWQAARVRVRQSIVRGVLGDPKSYASSRGVPMTARLGRELELHHQRSAYTADDEYVFCHPSTGNPYDPSRMRSRFKVAAAAAGVRDAVRFHDLRHTFGTRMAAVGTPMRTLQEWMGHSSIKTTEIYADYAPSPQDQAWAERAFGGASPAGSERDGIMEEALNG